MPIKIPKHLPAASILSRENVFVMYKERAELQDIRELRILILNLMPTKIETETQLLRLLGNSPLQVEVDLLKLKTYAPKNTSEDHLLKFYKTPDEIVGRRFDGMIITGAPIEHLAFEEVDYWQELTEIMDWALEHVTSIFYICWGAQAALYHHYGVPKYTCEANKKVFGIFKHKTNKKHSELLRGFDDEFFVPQSRHTEVRREDIEKVPDLEILSESEESGVYLMATPDLKQVFVTGHSEYDPHTLKGEYDRDVSKNLPIEVPKNYFKNDNPKEEPFVQWRAHANLLYTNWLNYGVYQITDFNLEDSKPSAKHDTVNIALFGCGLVGTKFLEILQENIAKILDEENIELRLFAIANSKHILFNDNGLPNDWREQLQKATPPSDLPTLYSYVKAHDLKNLIFIDATADQTVALSYPDLAKQGFNLVAANKKANTEDFNYYKYLRDTLQFHQKKFLYETNVGAGLPLIETIKYLVKSGDTITKIVGVFSGTLSYIFNLFSVKDKPFSEIMKQAMTGGLTEPDPREDLSGMDVARKLLILSREIGCKTELDKVSVQSLIPKELRRCTFDHFMDNLSVLDTFYDKVKSDLKPDSVLRYVGELSEGSLSVKLITVTADTALGKLSNADTIFEIYTNRYNSTPLIIQGAGAGAEVTASGVFSDILKLAQSIKYET